jgi:hypothetical protein
MPAEPLPTCLQVEPAQHLSPTLVTSSFSQDESRGVVTGDPALYGVSLSQYWQGYAGVVRGALKGGGLSSITAKGALADFPLMDPLWASPEVLKQLPPLIIQVRRCRLLLPHLRVWRARRSGCGGGVRVRVAGSPHGHLPGSLCAPQPCKPASLQACIGLCKYQSTAIAAPLPLPALAAGGRLWPIPCRGA